VVCGEACDPLAGGALWALLKIEIEMTTAKIGATVFIRCLQIVDVVKLYRLRRAIPEVGEKTRGRDRDAVGGAEHCTLTGCNTAPTMGERPKISPERGKSVSCYGRLNLVSLLPESIFNIVISSIHRIVKKALPPQRLTLQASRVWLADCSG
jgi:hypothetical protein